MDLRRSGLGLGVLALCVGLAACTPEDDPLVDNQEDQENQANQNQHNDNQENQINQGECELVFELPDGDPYALKAHSLNQPESIVGLVSGYIDSIPPLLLFGQGMSTGDDDPVMMIGGVGERTSYGDDEVPDTEEDVYAMYTGSISPDTCQFQARLEGATVSYELEAFADSLLIDLGGFAAVLDGMSLRVEDVVLTGQFDSTFTILDEVLLKGVLYEDGVEELLEVAREETSLPISTEQAMELLDPEGTGEIQVELGLAGHRVVVDGFMDPAGDVEIEPREESECCPDGLAFGESVIPYLTWAQQGLTELQHERFLLALPAFRDDPNVAMVTTAVRQPDGEIHYHVYSGGAVDEGRITFTRHAGDDGRAPRFEIVEQTGVNPLANTDATGLSTYEEFLSAGLNPEGTIYESLGYGAGDPRLSFIPAPQMNYPFAMERIAQNFDDPRTGDLIIIPATWSTGGLGTHGNLGSLQSRSPLLIFGPGIRSAADGAGDDATVESIHGGETLIVEEVARQVDIAPTVAAALGVDRTSGVGPDLRLRDDLYLAWQDGRVLEEVFTSEALDAIEAGEPVADHAVIIINDGLTNIELLYQVLSESDDYDIGHYREFFRRGLAYRYGSISNFPSNTYPGHNTVGSGAWAGHHGVIDNNFWIREQAVQASPIGNLFETEYLMGSAHENLPVETIHEAVMRTYGVLNDGVLAGASIHDPSSRGAEFATLERRLPGDFSMPSEADSVVIGETVIDLPPADLQDYAAVMDNASTQAFVTLYQDHINRGEEGLPIPKFSIVNFGSTDTAGHAHGPHGDHERYTVIHRVNQRMGVLLEVLEYLGIDDSTLVVLTSDHGMELQDQSRSSNRARALSETDIQFRRAGWYYYFMDLATEVEGIQEVGDEVRLSLRVIDAGTKGTEEPVGVAEVDVVVVSGGQGETVRTDGEGYAEITVTPDGDFGDVLFEFDHPQWNFHRERF